MAYLPHIEVEYVEENEATGEIAEIYEDVRRTTQLPIVPNAVKALSGAPAILAGYWSMYKTYLARVSLPPSLISMVHYAVASSNDCTYCSSWNELSCRTYGIDEETLVAMTRDLPRLTPERVRSIIQFALKVVHTPQSVEKADYESLRDIGLSDEEIVELVMISALGMLHDILADALKIDVDAMIVDGLAEVRRA